VDDDTDGLTDCDDLDCLDVPPCLPCVPAETLTCGDWGQWVTVPGSTLSPAATDDLVTYPCTNGDFRGREYTYALTAQCNQQVELEVSSRTPGSESPFIRLRVFQVQDVDGRCDPRNCLRAGTMEQVPSEQTATRSRSTLSVGLRKGETHYFVVDGFGDDQGAYDLYFRCNLLQPVSCL